MSGLNSSHQRLGLRHPHSHQCLSTAYRPARCPTWQPCPRDRCRVRSRLRVGVGASGRVACRDNAGLQSGQNFPLGGFGAHGALGAFGARGLLRAAPLATSCWPQAPWGASRSQSALHMHVLVCICSNVWQFQEIIEMIQLCYHTNHCACWPCFVNTEVFLCYKTERHPNFTVVHPCHLYPSPNPSLTSHPRLGSE